MALPSIRVQSMTAHSPGNLDLRHISSVTSLPSYAITLKESPAGLSLYRKRRGSAEKGCSVSVQRREPMALRAVLADFAAKAPPFAATALAAGLFLCFVFLRGLMSSQRKQRKAELPTVPGTVASHLLLPVVLFCSWEYLVLGFWALSFLITC